MRIGVLGGGQLGRMLALAGYPLGLQFRFFDVVPDAPAADVGELVVGAYDDQSALERFVSGVDLVTYEFENVPIAAAHWLASRIPIWPPLEGLQSAQDRQSERDLFAQLKLATPRSVPAETAADVRDALAITGCPAILKTRRLGYDGKGQAVIRQPADIEAAMGPLAGMPLLLDQFVPFQRELSIVAVRDAGGRIEWYPLAENIHDGGILRWTYVRAHPTEPHGMPDDSLVHTARNAIQRVMESLRYVGVMALEFFEHDGTLLLNEMAPRVHNTGHWSIDGAVCSQFENHLRAGCGLPLGSTAPTGMCLMYNLIGHVPQRAAVLATPGAHLHLYGKAAMPGRKLGHVTIVAPTESELAIRAGQLAQAGAIDVPPSFGDVRHE